jgi:dTDP-L-rhamnose 4-epimerase
MNKHVLVTGGAGFIGAHVTDALIRNGCRVRVLDSLVSQVHGPERKRPQYLHPDAELIIGDVRDLRVVSKAVRGADAVVHLAALVGVGQSMYQIDEYTNVNIGGTATLMQVLSTQPVECVVVASSMSIYGEGSYEDVEGNPRIAGERSSEQLKAGDWEMRDGRGRPLAPIPTAEDKNPALASIYAVSKYSQERIVLLAARAYGIRAVALRFFNTYGPYQSLSNPYTGVLSNFATRVLNGRPPLIYEDGLQKRDFVSVRDVASACRLALEAPDADGQALNISSGQAVTIKEIAEQACRILGAAKLQPEITRKYRTGDIRHCFADISRAKEVLGWRPTVTLEQGLDALAVWLRGQRAIDRVVQARSELASRGLMI